SHRRAAGRPPRLRDEGRIDERPPRQRRRAEPHPRGARGREPAPGHDGVVHLDHRPGQRLHEGRHPRRSGPLLRRAAGERRAHVLHAAARGDAGLLHASAGVRRGDVRARESRGRGARGARGEDAMKKLWLLVILVPFIVDLVFPFPEARLHRAPAIAVYDRDGAPMRIILPPDGKVRIPIELDELPPELVRAVVASEDRWFWRHPGVNPGAIVRAAWSNARAGRRVSGASTIPMQIARLTRPRSRTIFAKAIEAFRAVQLTAHHSKRELLEIYLNLAPYGGNVEGIGAAAQLYFGKEPSRLSIGEVAFLTTLPRSPNRYDPLRDHAAATRARDRVLRQLRDRGAFSTAEIAAAMR